MYYVQFRFVLNSLRPKDDLEVLIFLPLLPSAKMKHLLLRQVRIYTF